MIDLRKNLHDEENKNNTLSKLNMLTQKCEIEMEKNTLKSKIKNEDQKKLKNKIEEKNNLEKNNTKNVKLNLKKNRLKKNYFIFGIIFILLIILNLFNFNLIKNKIINYLILFFIPFEIIIFIFYILKNKKNIKKEKIYNELNEKITILNSER